MAHEDIYVKTKELTDLLTATDEFRSFKEIKDKVMASAATSELINQYKRMQFEAQTMMMSGAEVSPELMERLQQLGSVLQFNSDVTAYLMAEYRIQSLVAEVYKMIGQACETGAELFEAR